MFTDLRGFTALSDSIEPEQVVRILNQYFESMFGICQKYKGIINEILGDGLVAYFGAPLIDENHIENAIACAVQMQNAMIKIKTKPKINPTFASEVIFLKLHFLIMTYFFRYP